ncbi:stage 0 sporulation family protein [uncultured Jatrophihabitans sp.]|uniref:PSP1 domain-containing protein n=1 Tax=uncultured Jatrophihabitans sp. TaxID=1610747 RepID=UPI0035CB37BA
MVMMCAVTFQPQGRLYYADPGELRPAVGEHVLYPTADGDEVAQVTWAPEWVDDDIGGLPVLSGMAADDDIAAATASRKHRAAVRVAARTLIREHDLPMKIAGIDHVPAGHDASSGHTTLYFTAPQRVDFRGLVRDLAATLKGRIELRQLSARDEARLTGGLGSCGRELCCATFLNDFEPVSVRMARDQDLPVNPLRISGACGKLMCCLKYEHPLYQDFAEQAPALGSEVDTDDGRGTVVGHNVPGEQVVVRMSDTGRRTTCALASVCGSRKAYESRET